MLRETLPVRNHYISNLNIRRTADSSCDTELFLTSIHPDHYPSPSIAQGFETPSKYANSSARSLSEAIEASETRANPHPRAEPTMNTTRFFRPLARAAFRQPTLIRPSVVARPALAASQNQSQKTEMSAQQMVRSFTGIQLPPGC